MAKRLNIPEDLLKRLYYDKGLPVERVAQRLGCSDATIWRSSRL